MNYKEFYTSLKQIKHVYLLAGAESYYVDRGVEDILKRLFKSEIERNESLVKIDGEKITDINEIITAIEKAPLFSDKNVILIKNCTLFKTKQATSEEGSKSTKSNKKDPKLERLIKTISNMLETNYVIFTSKETADKRKALYKAIALYGVILDAEQLRPWQIDNWLNYVLKSLGKKMNTDAHNYFIELISMLPEISLNYLQNELIKTSLYVEGEIITKKDLQIIMAEPPEVSSFALIDSITDKNLKKAIYLLNSQVNERKEIMVITLLVGQVRRLMRAKHYMRNNVKVKDIATALNLNFYIAQKTCEAAKKFSDKVLEDALLMLADADYYYKVGKSGTEMLERIIVKLILNH